MVIRKTRKRVEALEKEAAKLRHELDHLIQQRIRRSISAEELKRAKD